VSEAQAAFDPFKKMDISPLRDAPKPTEFLQASEFATSHNRDWGHIDYASMDDLSTAASLQ